MTRATRLVTSAIALALTGPLTAATVGFPQDTVTPERADDGAGATIYFDHAEPHRMAQTIVKARLTFGADLAPLPEGMYFLIGGANQLAALSDKMDADTVTRSDWPPLPRPRLAAFAPAPVSGTVPPMAEFVTEPPTIMPEPSDGLAGILPGTVLTATALTETGETPAPQSVVIEAPVVSVVPVPAGLMLMVSALGAFGLAAHRARRA